MTSTSKWKDLSLMSTGEMYISWCSAALLQFNWDYTFLMHMWPCDLLLDFQALTKTYQSWMWHQRIDCYSQDWDAVPGPEYQPAYTKTSTCIMIAGHDWATLCWAACSTLDALATRQHNRCFRRSHCPFTAQQLCLFRLHRQNCCCSHRIISHISLLQMRGDTCFQEPHLENVAWLCSTDIHRSSQKVAAWISCWSSHIDPWAILQAVTLSLCTRLWDCRRQ